MTAAREVAVFTGVVHPVAQSWSFERPIRRLVDNEQWELTVRRSQFRVVIAPIPALDLATLKNEALSFVRGSLDGLGFHLATPLVPELTGGFVFPNVIVEVTYGWRELALALPESEQFVPAATLEPYVRGSIEEPLLRWALADLASAIDRPEDTAFYAFRAVESVRQYFLDGEPDDGSARRRSWERMRTELSEPQPDLDWLAQAARARRHGNGRELDAASRRRALDRARTVVDKFVKYLATRRDGVAT